MRSPIPLPIGSMPIVHRVGRAEHGLSEDSLREYYRMKDVWCLHLYSFHGHLTVNGERMAVTPYSASIAPPWSEMSFEYEGPSLQMSAFFTFTAENARIVDVPIMTYVEDDFDQLWRLMAETLDIFPLFPDRVSVRVWDILWSLVDRCETSAGSAGSMPSRVREAVHYIENSLNGPIRVQSIADAVGVTPTHLARLFRACFGTTVIAYIRWRRTQKARDLLLHTDIPIKQVADNVGFTDIQHLYKIFRAELGQTPGSVRAGEDCGGHRFAFDAQTVSRLQETARPSTVPALGD